MSVQALRDAQKIMLVTALLIMNNLMFLTDADGITESCKALKIIFSRDELSRCNIAPSESSRYSNALAKGLQLMLEMLGKEEVLCKERLSCVLIFMTLGYYNFPSVFIASFYNNK